MLPTGRQENAVKQSIMFKSFHLKADASARLTRMNCNELISVSFRVTMRAPPLRVLCWKCGLGNSVFMNL